MNRITTWAFKGLALGLLIFMAAGCDTVEDLFENDKEVTGVVEAIGDASLTVDGVAYTVTDKTEYEGITGLADLSVGDEVEVEYEESNSGRVALEVELAGAEDDDKAAP